jgi:hypothetical protein
MYAIGDSQTSLPENYEELSATTIGNVGFILRLVQVFTKHWYVIC